jgi:methyl halide transferase
MNALGKNYWGNRYKLGETGWDVGEISLPLKEYIDQIKDKNIKILVPGAGNAHEVEYLHHKGFKQVFLLDITSEAIDNFRKRVPDFPTEHIILQDFFDHQNQYDLILEQTFFCAIEPGLRKKYVEKMAELLTENGRLVGLLFNIPLNEDKPPFGGKKSEYEQLFQEKFELKKLETAYNSIPQRAGNELFINLKCK